MPKRRRLLTIKKKSNHNKSEIEDKKDATPNSLEKEVSTARGRLKGALLEALEPVGEESDASIASSPSKRNGYPNHDSKWDDESEEEQRPRRRRSPARQSYVLKLFDRSVDLSQFEEDSPLYPICRAWIANQPKADYSKFGKKNKEPESLEDSVELPGPEGPPVSRIPELLPEQKASSVDNINLNYEGVLLPSRSQLLQSHAPRWAGVRGAWLRQAARGEARYQRAQQLLNQIHADDMQITSNKIRVSFSSSDDDHIQRVRRSPSSNVDDIATQTQTPVPNSDMMGIQRQKKSEELAAVRAMPLATADLNIDGPARPIFECEINLYSQARKLCRKCGFAYIWIKDFEIFVKKSDGHKPILIADESDLEKIK